MYENRAAFLAAVDMGQLAISFWLLAIDSVVDSC